MAQITIEVEGTELKFFDSFAYSTQLDSIASSISFNTFIDFETFGYSNIQAFRNGVLIFTGEIVSKIVPEGVPIKPFTYKAESKPYALASTLPVTAYPLQLNNSTLKEVVEYICSFFDVTVIFDESASEEATNDYKESDLKLDDYADKIINELVTNEGLIMSHNADGYLVITKEIEQDEIILPRHSENNKSYDLKKFFHNYIALGQAPIGEDADLQAIATFDNIKPTRNITKIQDSGGIATIEKKALGMRADSLKAITQNLTFDNFFCNVGDFIVLGDNKLVVNKLSYSMSAKGEKASISVLDSLIYKR